MEIEVAVSQEPIQVELSLGTDEILVSTPGRLIEVELKASVGVPGPAGPPGAAGDTYLHTQETPAYSWPVQHDLGYRPTANVADSEFRIMEAEVVHDDENLLTVLFSSPATGYVFCS